MENLTQTRIVTRGRGGKALSECVKEALILSIEANVSVVIEGFNSAGFTGDMIVDGPRLVSDLIKEWTDK